MSGQLERMVRDKLRRHSPYRHSTDEIRAAIADAGTKATALSLVVRLAVWKLFPPRINGLFMSAKEHQWLDASTGVESHHGHVVTWKSR